MSYAFGKSQSFTLADLRAGEPLRQHQVMQEIHAYVGDPHDSFDAAAKALAAMLGEDDNLELERYEITRTGEDQPCYEMWVIASDNGLVFPIGSDEATAVHCSQSHFWSVDDDDAPAKALAEALNRVVPF